MMRRFSALFAVLVALVATATAAGRDPRLEQVRLTAADNALAGRISLTRGEVGAGFRKVTIPRSSYDSQLRCPGYSPNLSRFTITGKSTTAYVHASGVSIGSAVEVYESRADAAGDFALGATPAVARCLKLALEQEIRAGALLATVRSAKVVPAPHVGDRRIGYRVVAAVNTGVTTMKIYFDVLVVQRGRSIAALFFTAVNKPFGRQSALAAGVASRMR